MTTTTENTSWAAYEIERDHYVREDDGTERPAIAREIVAGVPRREALLAAHAATLRHWVPGPHDAPDTGHWVYDEDIRTVVVPLDADGDPVWDTSDAIYPDWEWEDVVRAALGDDCFAVLVGSREDVTPEVLDKFWSLSLCVVGVYDTDEHDDDPAKIAEWVEERFGADNVTIFPVDKDDPWDTARSVEQILGHVHDIHVTYTWRVEDLLDTFPGYDFEASQAAYADAMADAVLAVPGVRKATVGPAGRYDQPIERGNSDHITHIAGDDLHESVVEHFRALVDQALGSVDIADCCIVEQAQKGGAR